MRVLLRHASFLGVGCLAFPAHAHVGPPADAPGWWPDLWITAAILITLAAYLVGLTRLWRSAAVGRGVGGGRALCFALGLLTLFLALAPPLERMTGQLLTAHMVQHLLLITISPLLIMLGRPDIILAWAMPRKARRKLARRGPGREAAQLLHALARPLPATLLHGAAVWIWHAPALFQAALSDTLLHDLEHASFYFTALLFWHATLLSARAPVAAMKAILGLVITLIHGGLLGALLTLTPGALYPAYGEPLPFGLTPLEDQQLAGLIMWVPASAIYLGAALHLASRLLFLSGRQSASGDWMLTRARASRSDVVNLTKPQQERVKVPNV